GPTTVIMPFEDLNVFDELPDYVYSMPKPVYRKWAKLQNKGAYREAQRKADAYRKRNPVNPVYVQSNDYDSRVTQTQHEEVTPNTADFSGTNNTKYNGRSTQRAFVPDQWAGGPVHLINPYVDRPPKMIHMPNGQAVLADPDHVLNTQEKLDAFLKKLEAELK
ncbi:MAG: hypothetical protein ACPGLY_27690, partial [Rubripirellula sp.]